MRDQRARDDKTLDIAVALMIFTAVVAAGALALGLLHLAVGIPDDVIGGLSTVVAAVGVVAALVHLTRLRTRRHASSISSDDTGSTL